jgi:hypothetical protein
MSKTEGMGKANANLKGSKCRALHGKSDTPKFFSAGIMRKAFKKIWARTRRRKAKQRLEERIPETSDPRFP